MQKAWYGPGGLFQFRAKGSGFGVEVLGVNFLGFATWFRV